MATKASALWEAYKRGENITSQTAGTQTKNSQATKPSTQTTYKNRAQAEWETLKANGFRAKGVDEDYISSFLDEANSYLSSANKNAQASAKLKYKSWAISEYLDRNKSWLDSGFYNSFKSYLDDFNASLSNVQKWSDDPRFAAYDSNMAQAGWQKYTADKSTKASKEEEKPWYEKTLGYLSGASDTTLPTATVTTVIDNYRKDTSYMEPTDNWSEDLKNAFGFLYETDREGAWAFAEEVNNRLASEEKAKQRQAVQESATNNFWSGLGHTAGALATAPLGLADFLDDIAEYNARGTITDKGTLSPFEYSQAVTGGVSEHLNEKYGTLNEKIPVLGDKGIGDVYSLGTSIAQSAIAGHTGGSFGTLVQFFGSAAASGVDDAKQRGADDRQALMYGTMTGAAEAIAESIGIDNLLNIGNSTTMRELITNIAKQGLAEGMEEGVTSVLNHFADQLALGDKSNFQILVRNYRNNGWGEEEAKKQAWIDMAEDTAFDVLGGFVSGAIHAGPETAYNTYAVSKEYGSVYGESVPELLQEGLESLDGSLSHDLAVKYQEKLDSGGMLTGAEIYRLVKANEQQFLAEDKASIKQAAENRLTELGEVENVSALADILTKQATKQKLTMAEKNALRNSKFGLRVANELNPENIQSGKFSTTWVERIGTNRINPQQYNAGLMQLAEEATGAKPTEAENNLPATVNTPSANRYTSNEDGKTILRNDGTEVAIKEIASIKDGKMTLKLKDGRTVNASEVDYGTKDEALIYETVAKMGVNSSAANLLVDTYHTGNVPADVFAAGIEEAHRFGQNNYPKQELAQAPFASELTEHQRNTAYKLGQLFSGKQVAKAQAIAAQNTKAVDFTKKPTAGKVHFEGDRSQLTERQNTSISALERVADALGVQIHVFESEVDENGKRIGANGWYDTSDGSIHIDLHAGANGEGTMLFTAAHELTHFTKQWSPAKFKTLANFLMEEYGQQGVSVESLVQAQIAKAKGNGREIDYDTAYEEVIADSMETMLTDGNVMEKLAKLKQQDRTLWQKVKDFITDLAAKIRSVYEGLSPDSAEGRYVAEMKGSIERLQEMFTEGLVDASKNYQAAEGQKNTTQEGGEQRYSLREFEDGTRFVEVDQDQDRFDGHDAEEYPRIAKAIINEKFNGHVIGTDNKMFVNGSGRDEFANPSKHLDSDLYETKMRTAGELDNLLDAGTNYRNEPDGADGHIHPDVVGGFDYFDTLFKIGNRYFSAVINIKNIKRGKLFKDVTKIKDVTQDIMSSYGQNPKSQFLRTSSIDSIRGIQENVNKKFSERNSDGDELTEAQVEYFQDSKVRDTDGNLLVMYHGTPSGGFTKFRPGSYFTQNLDYAAVYQSPTASMLSVKRGVNDPQTYKVYLNITKPFDTRKPKERKIFMQEYYRQYGTGAPLAESGLPDWTDGMDLQEFIEEQGYDYDGLILDEGATGGYGEEVKSRGLSYVTFDPAQVKSVQNRKPTTNPDYRYSDRNPDAAKVNSVLQKENAKLKEAEAGNTMLESEIKQQARQKSQFTDAEIQKIQSIGRKSINSFSSKDIQETEFLAKRYWGEMGAKSPFFRAWFGDWRENDNAPVQIANKHGDTRGVQHNDDTGWDIHVSGKVFAESRHFAKRNTSAIPYLPYINDIVKKAILLDSHGIDQGKTKSPNTLLMHSMYSLADIGNGPEVLKLYVEEMNDPNLDNTSKRAYQLQNIEKALTINGGVQSNSPSSLANTANAIHTVADLFAAVKKKEHGFVPNPTSVVANSDGTPKEMYHGTSNGGFTKFNTYGGKFGLFGKGSYFTDNPEVAQSYTSKGKGKEPNVYSVYLNIKNPLDMDAKADMATWKAAFEDFDLDVSYLDGAVSNEDAFRQLKENLADAGYVRWEAEDLVTDMIESMGYDGITHIGGGRYGSKNGPSHRVFIAFYPEQIKDSINNIGTFDGNNPDIRYQDRPTESVSNRALLANAFEGVAQNDIERKKIQEYREKISSMEAEEQKLRELNAQIKELSFSTGKRDTAKIRELRDEATKSANRLSIYDKQLIRLEASQPLQNVLDREKSAAYKRAEQKGKAALEEYRQKTMKKQQEIVSRYQESRAKGIENRHRTEMRKKIKNFKEKLEDTMQHSTDRRYIPASLFSAMVDVCNLIDTDTTLYKKDGSINKAQEQRNLTKEKLQALKDEYEKLGKNPDPMYSGEFDDMVYTYLTELNDKFKDKNLADMSLDELSEMYEILRAIDETIMDARKLIGWGDAEGVYEAGDAIVAEQAEITKGRKKGKRNAVQKTLDNVNNLSLSPIRNVERMAGYNQNSQLLKLFKKFEQGVRKKNKFVMDAYKSFEKLATGKKYDDAVYNEASGKKYVDVNGRKFGVSKMQMMQAILSFERENANNMSHISGSGFCFADLDMLRKGKLRDAISEEYSHRIPAAIDMVAEFQTALKNDKWCQAYMAAARKFFNETAKNAINETSIVLKHRIVAKDKNYIPFEVDKNFIVREISAANDIQQTINSYGILKDTKQGASQPLIITGLNNVLDRHIEQVGNIYGLAIEVRNFNKVWNVRSVDSVSNDPTVKTAVQRNWGVNGIKQIEQAVQDIQGPRMKEQSALVSRVKSGYISATFMLNLSVVTKQIGSLFSSTSMLQWRDPSRMIGNLIYTMANSKKISAEVDKYTATAWMRRQGMSDDEVYTLITQAKTLGVFHLLDKAPTIVNPTKWITAMDHAVALSLWRYAKIDTAKRTGLKGEELLRATADFYDEVIENTQSMTDVLHRPEIQKRSDVVSESLGLFKTDLYQMAGQLQAVAGRFAVNKSKDNAKALGRTVYSVAMGAIWGQLMTTAFALLRYKVDGYRDEEDKELTIESWLKRQAFSAAGDLMGYIVPLFGSEAVGIIENIVYGDSEDIVDSLALTAINDLYSSIVMIASSIKDGEMPETVKMKKLAIHALQVLGIPANNILRTMEAIQLHAKDIANSEFFSFEAGVERSPSEEMHRIAEAIVKGENDIASWLYEDALEKIATKKADGGEYDEDEINEARSSLQSALGDKYKEGKVSKETATRILSELFEKSEDEIYWIFDKWDYSKENGSSDDYAKYGEFFNAVETGKNLRAVIKEYTDNGVEVSTLASQITLHFRPEYVQMSASERAKIKGYILNGLVQCGIEREDAEKRLANWDFEADYGFAYEDRREAYKNEEVTAAKLKKALVNSGNYTEEEAALQVEVYDWMNTIPGCDGVSYTAIEEYHEYCEPAGISKELYYDAWSFYNDTEPDYDENGEGIAYSKVKKVMPYIGSLNLTDDQKTALALCWWAKSTVNKYKTW